MYEKIIASLLDSMPKITKHEIYTFLFYSINFKSLSKDIGINKSVRNARLAVDTFLKEYEDDEKK